MLQRYKLRLGDGTVLGVDHDGLSTWLADRRAMVQAAGSGQWHPLNEFLARERAAARAAARQRASARDALPLVPSKPLPLVYPKARPLVAPKALPLVYPKPRESPMPSPSVAPPPPEPVEPPPVTEASEASIAEALVEPVLPEEPTASDDWYAEPASIPDEEPLVLSVAPLDTPEEAPPSAALLSADPLEPLPVDGSLAAQTLADDDIPSTALEPLDEEPPVIPAVSSWWEPVGSPASPPRPNLQVLADDPAAPPAAAPPKPASARQGWAPDDLPIIPLKPLDDERPSQVAADPGKSEEGASVVREGPERSTLEEALQRGISRAVSAYTALLSDWIDRLGRRLRPTSPRVPSLADLGNAEDAGEAYAKESPFQPAWLWAKRIAKWTGLGVGVLLAALNWEAWVPRTAELGRLVAARLDSLKESKDLEESQGRALQEATRQLPHLTPATIRLVLSTSPTVALDPAEVFYLACEAVDRGRTAFTSAEALELKALRAELLDALRPSERARVREYDGARARRLALPFENRDVLDLFARGTAALPSTSRLRLRELHAKAVAAGLAISPAASEPRTSW